MFFDFGFGQPVDYDTGTNLEMAFSNYFTEITGRSPTPFASSLSTDLAIGARAGTARPAEGLRRVEEDPRAVERELRTAAGPAGGAATIRGADEINTGLEPNISDIVSKEGLVPAGLRPVGQAKYTVWKREPGGRIRAVGTSDDLEAATLNAEREMFEMDQDMFAVDPTEITDASLMPGGDKWKAGFGSINSDAETFVTGPGARIRSTD